MGMTFKQLELLRRPTVVIDTCVLLHAMVHRVYPEYTPKPKLTRDMRESFTALAMAKSTHAMCFSSATMQEAFYMISTMKRDYMKGEQRKRQRLEFVQKYIDPYSRQILPASTGLRCRDKDDQMFLEAAAGVRAEFIVTTDDDLLTLKYDGFCEIVPPSVFCRKMAWRKSNPRQLQQHLAQLAKNKLNPA